MELHRLQIMKLSDHLTDGKSLGVHPRAGGSHPDMQGQMSPYGPTALQHAPVSEHEAVALGINTEASTWQKVKTERRHRVWRLYKFFPSRSRDENSSLF